jgi:hypothetical protein
MIIIGHPWIKSNRFFRIFAIKGIEKSLPADIVLLEPLVDTHDLAIHCQSNNIPFAVVVNGLEDALFANSLGAKYIICEEDDALMIQPIATEYLFDTRVLVLIHSEKEIAKIARAKVDGVIFAEAIC